MVHRLEYGFVEATAVSAHELDATSLADIKDILKHEYPDAKSYHINTRIDAALVGGVRVELPDQQLDLTLRRKLSTFKRLTMQGKE